MEYHDPTQAPSRADQLAAEILGNGLEFESFRPHAIPNLWGASNRASLNRWFNTIGAKLKPSDRLIIYYTGHGGRAASNGQGTTLALWNENPMSVREFNRLLDRLPPTVPVTLVMVQCFSGGFADFIYSDCNASRGLSPRPRCGFFATPADRPAAGCTPDIAEEDYKEYSTYFWAALAGHTRTGKPVSSADYDGNGVVSFAEAHAYCLLNSDTIDISLKSSDVLLRRFSRTTGPIGGGQDLLSPTGDFSRLLAAAPPADAAVLTGLAKTLKLDAARPVSDAGRLASELERQRKELDEKVARLRSDHRRLQHSLARRLRSRWPELGGAPPARLADLVARQGDQIVQFVEAMPRFRDFEPQEAELDKLENQSLDLERTWVKTQRYLRTAETVALAANLPKVADPDVVKKYRQMIAMEAITLQP